MRGFKKYERNWILMMAFWATYKVAQPIQPIWQPFFALPWSALKKPPLEFNFFNIFGIPSSSRHEKCCQMLERLFVLFHHSRNIPWQVNAGLYICGFTDTPLWSDKQGRNSVSKQRSKKTDIRKKLHATFPFNK